MEEELSGYGWIIDLFLAGRMPNMNHARHLAIANILKHVPHGRELVHLGIQITAIRAGAPEKYCREITDRYWDKLDGTLPALEAFDDALPHAFERRRASSASRTSGHSVSRMLK